MDTMIPRRLRAVQNVGLMDRLIRAVIGAALVLYPMWDLQQGAMFSWHGLAFLLSTYPMLTAILGWDPVYQLFEVRSCGQSRRNQCGTFPYEVDAAVGHRPIPDRSHRYDHSLSSARHLKR